MLNTPFIKSIHYMHRFLRSFMMALSPRDQMNIPKFSVFGKRWDLLIASWRERLAEFEEILKGW
jgi:hypothetical protein